VQSKTAAIAEAANGRNMRNKSNVPHKTISHRCLIDQAILRRGRSYAMIFWKGQHQGAGRDTQAHFDFLVANETQ
jgi:hypothetical protein